MYVLFSYGAPVGVFKAISIAAQLEIKRNMSSICNDLILSLNTEMVSAKAVKSRGSLPWRIASATSSSDENSARSDCSELRRI